MSKSLDVVKEFMIKNKDFMSEWINILLVWTGGREATLIESSNTSFGDDVKGGLKIVFSFVKLLNEFEVHNELFIIHDKLSLKRFPRYFITSTPLPHSPKNDKEIGKLLGMYCYDHDYSNYYVDRIGFNIHANVGGVETYEVFAEVCEMDVDLDEIKTFYEQKIDSWDKCMKEIDFQIDFHYDYDVMTGLETLLKKIKEKDLEYIKKNLSHYYNLIQNFGTDTLDRVFKKYFLERDEVEKKIKTLSWIVWLSYPFVKGENGYIHSFNKDEQLNLLNKVKNINLPKSNTKAHKILKDLLSQ